jgi:NTP pyrophosphatase (non-canonical NTP hydrolase)
MNFNEYQKAALETAVYPSKGSNLVYPAMGMAGEAGEFLDKVKKNWRNHDNMSGSNLTLCQRTEFAKEIGDVLWYIAAASKELGFTLDMIVGLNIQKLLDRRARGVLKSEGDNR